MMGSGLKNFLFDFFGMMLAGANFVGGMYLVYIRRAMVIAIFLFVIALTIWALLSLFDIEIIEEED